MQQASAVMEDSKGMQNLVENGTIQGWPYVQHEFFPSGGFRDTSHRIAHMQDRLNDPPVTQHLIQGNCASSNVNEPGLNHWRGSWNLDSLSFSVQCITSLSTVVNLTNGSRSLEDCPLKLSVPLKSNMSQSDSMSLALELKNASSEKDGLLDLKLGGKDYAFGGAEVNTSVKRSRHSSPGTHHPRCQVDNCAADLKDAKDYHRRHKVCEVHAKALKAPVSRIMQRFCQQCSRFHSLQEFDDDRRSCRRRLAGHNRRRRKSQPDALAASAGLLADQNLLARLMNLSAQDKGTHSLVCLRVFTPKIGIRTTDNNSKGQCDSFVGIQKVDNSSYRSPSLSNSTNRWTIDFRAQFGSHDKCTTMCLRGLKVDNKNVPLVHFMGNIEHTGCDNVQLSLSIRQLALNKVFIEGKFKINS